MAKRHTTTSRLQQPHLTRQTRILRQSESFCHAHFIQFRVRPLTVGHTRRRDAAVLVFTELPRSAVV